MGSDTVNNLQQRLTMVTEWHERAQAELARCLGSKDHTASLRKRIENSDSSIPLLQCYDSTIAEKDRELAEAKGELARLKGQLENVTAIARESSVGANTVKEKAELQVEEANVKLRQRIEECTSLKEQLAHTQRELASLRDMATNLQLGDNGNAKETIKRLARELELKDEAWREATTLTSQLQHQTATLQAQLAGMKQQLVEDRTEQETQKVQLHLAARENDDKVQEIERLRDKMVATLKHSNENHNTHLQMIEAKHRNVVESLRQEARQHEATVMKLKAQLSRVDVIFGGGSGALTVGGALSSAGGQGNHASGNRSGIAAISDLVESQAKHAMELEIKRLYADLSTAQLQRDDLQSRLEQTLATRRWESDQNVRSAQKDAELLSVRLKEIEERSARLESELEKCKDTIRQLRDEAKTSASDRAKLQREKTDAVARCDDAKRAAVSSLEEVDRARQEGKDRLEAEERLRRTLERRMEECKRDEQAMRDRAAGDLADLSRTVNELKGANQDLHDQLAAAQAALAEKERLLESAVTKANRMSQGLTSHKNLVATCEARIAELLQREAQLSAELRDLNVFMEKCRLENVRISRDRERYLQEVKLLTKRNAAPITKRSC